MARHMRTLPLALLAGIFAAGVFAAPVFAQAGGTPSQGATPLGAAGQSYSDATVNKAGHALRDVLTINEAYRQKIVAQPDMNARRQIAAEAQAKATQAVNKDGLTVDQYNRILGSARADPTLRSKLLSAAGIDTRAQ